MHFLMLNEIKLTWNVTKCLYTLQRQKMFYEDVDEHSHDYNKEKLNII